MHTLMASGSATLPAEFRLWRLLPELEPRKFSCLLNARICKLWVHALVADGVGNLAGEWKFDTPVHHFIAAMPCTAL